MTIHSASSTSTAGSSIISIELCVYNTLLISPSSHASSADTVSPTTDNDYPKGPSLSFSISPTTTSTPTSSSSSSSKIVLHSSQKVKLPSSSLLQVNHMKKLVRLVYPALSDYTLYATTNQGGRINATDTEIFESFITQYIQTYGKLRIEIEVPVSFDIRNLIPPDELNNGIDSSRMTTTDESTVASRSSTGKSIVTLEPTYNYNKETVTTATILPPSTSLSSDRVYSSSSSSSSSSSVTRVPIPVSILSSPTPSPLSHVNNNSSRSNTVQTTNGTSSSSSFINNTKKYFHAAPVLKKDENSSTTVQINTVYLPILAKGKNTASGINDTATTSTASKDTVTTEMMDQQLQSWLNNLEPLVKIQHPSLLPCVGIDVFPNTVTDYPQNSSLVIQLYEPYPTLPSLGLTVPHIEVPLFTSASLSAPKEALPTEPTVPEKQCKLIFQELLQILALLHSQRIVHGDLVLDHVYTNILAKDTDSSSFNGFPFPESQLQLGGLCCSHRLQQFMPYLQRVSSETASSSISSATDPSTANVPFIAPGPKMDTWSLGVILLELLVGYRFLPKLPCPDNQLRALEIHCDQRKWLLVEEAYQAWLQKKMAVTTRNDTSATGTATDTITKPLSLESSMHHQASTTTLAASSIPKFYRGTSYMQDIAMVSKGFASPASCDPQVNVPLTLSSSPASSPFEDFDISSINFAPVVSWYIDEANKIASVYSTEVEGPHISSIFETLSPECLHFLDNCLQVDRYQRPTPTELLAHPWIGLGHLLIPVSISSTIDTQTKRVPLSSSRSNISSDTIEASSPDSSRTLPEPKPVLPLKVPSSRLVESRVTGLALNDGASTDHDQGSSGSLMYSSNDITPLSSPELSPPLMMINSANPTPTTKVYPLGASVHSRSSGLSMSSVSSSYSHVHSIHSHNFHHLSSFQFRTPLFSSSSSDGSSEKSNSPFTVVPPGVINTSSDTVGSSSKSVPTTSTFPSQRIDFPHLPSSFNLGPASPINESDPSSSSAAGNPSSGPSDKLPRNQDKVSHGGIPLPPSALGNNSGSSSRSNHSLGSLNVSVVKNNPHIVMLDLPNESTLETPSTSNHVLTPQSKGSHSSVGSQRYEGILRDFSGAIDSMMSIDSLFSTPSNSDTRTNGITPVHRGRAHTIDRQVQLYAAAYVDRLYRRTGTNLPPASDSSLLNTTRTNTSNNDTTNDYDTDMLVQTDGWFLHDPRMELNKLLGNKDYEEKEELLNETRYNEYGLTKEQELFLYNNNDDSMDISFLDGTDIEKADNLNAESVENGSMTMTKSRVPDTDPSLHMTTNGSHLSVITHLSPTIVHDKHANASAAHTMESVKHSPNSTNRHTQSNDSVSTDSRHSSSVFNTSSSTFNSSPLPYASKTPSSSRSTSSSSSASQGFFSRLFSPFSSSRPSHVLVPKTELSNTASPHRRNNHTYPPPNDSENDDRLLSSAVTSTTHSVFTLGTEKSTATTVPLLQSPPPNPTTTSILSPGTINVSNPTTSPTTNVGLMSNAIADTLPTVRTVSAGNSSSSTPSTSFFSRWFSSKTNKIQPV